MASREISHLHPHMQVKAEEFQNRCLERGVHVLIYCTYRSGKEQDILYAMGRTTKSNVGVSILRPLGKIVTNAKAGQSAHNFTLNGRPASKAWDCCPTIGGKPIWDGKHPHWQIMGQVAAELGLEWYGAPGSKFKEQAHFQMR